MFAYFACFDFCPFSLPLGVGVWIRIVAVSLPGHYLLRLSCCSRKIIVSRRFTEFYFRLYQPPLRIMFNDPGPFQSLEKKIKFVLPILRKLDFFAHFAWIVPKNVVRVKHIPKLILI